MNVLQFSRSGSEFKKLRALNALVPFTTNSQLFLALYSRSFKKKYQIYSWSLITINYHSNELVIEGSPN